MIQPKLPTGRSVSVDKIWDHKGRDIKYIGTAEEMLDGTWVCLAVVSGALCIVEVKIKEQA